MLVYGASKTSTFTNCCRGSPQPQRWLVLFPSVVLLVYFEVGLRVVADGADLGSLGADDDMAAVAAFPHLDFALGKDLFGLDVMQQGAVTLFVMLLDGGHATKLGGQLGEALGLGGAGKAFVHVRPLIVLTCGGSGQILGGGADAVQLLEPQLGVLLLVLGGLQEEGGNLPK